MMEGFPDHILVALWHGTARHRISEFAAASVWAETPPERGKMSNAIALGRHLSRVTRRANFFYAGREVPRIDSVMTVIELPDEQAALLKARAAAEGLTLEDWFSKLAQEIGPQESHQPFKTGRGMLAKYGTAPSAEEIDENRRDMFRNFGRDF